MRPPLPEYPWEALTPFVEKARSHASGVIDVSVGSPIDPTPDVVKRALTNATDAHGYPSAAGTAELRAAIADWYRRRRGVTVTEAEVLPTVGSKELIALLPFLLGIGQGHTIVTPTLAYPTYAMGASLVQADVLSSDDPADWPATTKLIWLNSPANPHGRVLSHDELRAAVVRARELGAVIASDECYAELGWEEPYRDEPTPSILHPDITGGDHTGILSVYSLSKQSNLAGYRAGIVAGDAALMQEILNVRKHAGLVPPAPVQAAMTAALKDVQHVREQRERYRRRRNTLKSALERAGFTMHHSEAGLYLWVTNGDDSWATVDWFAERGIIVGPGTFYGPEGERFVRVSLTASDEDVTRLAERLQYS